MVPMFKPLKFDCISKLNPFHKEGKYDIDRISSLECATIPLWEQFDLR